MESPTKENNQAIIKDESLISLAVKKSSKSKKALIRWSSVMPSEVGKHRLLFIDETRTNQDELIDEISGMVPNHYKCPNIIRKELKGYGYPKTAMILRELFPTGKRSRSADIGEIIATEVVESCLEFKIPIRKLRWKDGRDVPLRGDDIIGINNYEGRDLKILKGEAKSRLVLSLSVLKDVGKALNKNKGCPAPHSIAFIISRLRERGNNALAGKFSEALVESFRKVSIEHMLFVFTENNPKDLLKTHLEKNAENRQPCHAIAMQVKEHQELIKKLFEKL